MLQFNATEMIRIRSRATDEFINQLIENNRIVLNSDILVPETGVATWNLYYFCPEHGVRLDWQRDKPLEHACPVDGKIYTGEPYDGAWWRYLNGLNAKACNDLGLLWQLTKDDKYLDKVKALLLEYAKYYPDYEEHGGIPYNGPGKANAQTLCEANCHLDFAKGYDFICEALNEDEREYIEVRLLREGAEFLMQHRSEQLHNHEMKISATIGVIGVMLNDERYIRFALESDYGLKYQLNHGVKGEGLWFEGSIHYNYYALQAALGYEKLARNTPYSIKSEPNFHLMLAFPLTLVSATGDFPRLNDCIAGQEKITHSHLFEFAYSEFGDTLFAQALQTIYRDGERNNIDALLYGVDELPEVPILSCHNEHASQSGVTIIHAEKHNNMLLLKHSPYGGEHDHYDRLGLILCRDGKEILPDLGTTGYGAELHYGYYKNTATHNTLVVEQSNQPPANPKVLNYLKTDMFTFVDTQVDWSEAVAELDSHTIVQWDSEAYQDVVFRRSILWLGDVAIELNQITNPHNKQLDLTWHTRGQLKTTSIEGSMACDNPLAGPLARMTGCQHHFAQGIVPYQYKIEGQSDYHQYLFVDQACEVLTGEAPDNPATAQLAYLLLRCKSSQLNTVMLHDLAPTLSKNVSANMSTNISTNMSTELVEVRWVGQTVELYLKRNGKLQMWLVDLSRAMIRQIEIQP